MRMLTFSFLKNCKYKKLCCGVTRMISGGGVLQPDVVPRTTGDPSLVQISPSWPEDEEPELRAAVLQDMQVYPDFITEREEVSLLNELEPRLRRMRYEFDHWDNAIQGFRETERSQWTSENSVVLSRVRGVAFGGELQPLGAAHVLDLAAAGHIKPHVDAVRFCGDVIAGLCLLSSAVMRLEHSDKPHLALDALLARRALYIMKGRARYEFTHAVPCDAQCTWRGARVLRARRVAVICRSRPHARHAQPDIKSGCITSRHGDTPE